eukprot:TRINITY_DN5221_c0_g1_i3.p1 TRINITY_DN5221_c0_g1~~TRINITY_DN5221_c0_g1_i3.p1  ORF type:complete len:2164 (+),score=981.26 TRINITY_DN5221_c0_g1_i3:29-6520(+)
MSKRKGKSKRSSPVDNVEELYKKILKYPKDAAFNVPGYGDKTMVWVPDKSDFGYTPAEVLQQLDGKKLVKLNNGDEQEIDDKNCQEMNPAKFEGVEDMSELGYLNEPSVLYNLKKRYEHDLIYTYSGLFLVAVNPYKQLQIYRKEIVQRYVGKRKNEVAPHIFAISDTAYRFMLEERKDQSLLITGESGAGKTENTKKVIQYLAAVAGRSHGEGQLEQQILELNPMLEAFGNAKTIRNNNSSRFGKYIRLQFNNSGNIAGATLQSYLLEKSRVSYQAPNERNYHIFYQMISGTNSEEKKRFHLLGPENFNYLNQSGCYVVERMDDAKEFQHTREAMRVCGINDAEQNAIFSVLGAILHLGNLEFDTSNSGGDGANISNMEELEISAELLEVEPKVLDDALIHPRIKAGKELIAQHFTVTKARDSRDALVKALYGRIFLWLVKRINANLGCSNPANFIGVLDISGFEIFEENSLEQLCINFTNEKLQQFFNNHMFKLEQEEYMREQIDWNFVDFDLDSQSTIDLIERKPNGILIILDEQTVFPKATDKTFCAKLHGSHQHNPRYDKPRFNDEVTFGVKHYAGKVDYTVTGWLEKNKDPLQNDLKLCIGQSKNSFVSGLMDDNLIPKVFKAPSSPRAGSSKSKAANFLTVGGQYKDQLTDLMDTLSATNPHFVRCILPNHKQRPGSLESDIILEQLRCNGVLEGIRITRMGFPNRIIYAEFLKRYHLLGSDIPRTSADPKQHVQTLMEQLKIDKEQYRLGLTKIFFRTGQLAKIEEMREQKIGELLVVIQAASRGFLARDRYRKMTARASAAKIIQRNLRNYLDFKTWGWWKLFSKARPLLKRRNFEEELNEKDVEINNLSKTLAEEKKNQEELQGKVGTLEQQVQQIKEDLEQKNSTIDDLETEKEGLQKEYDSLNKRLEILEADLEDERDTVNDLEGLKESFEKKSKELQKLLDSESSQREELESQVSSLESKIKNLSTEGGEKEDAIINLEEENASLKKKLNIANADLDDTRDDLDEIESERNTLKKQLNDLKFKLEDTSENLESLEDEKLALEKKVKDLNNELENNQLELGDTNEAITSFKKQLAQLKEDLEAEREIVDQMTKQNKDLSSAKKILEEDLEAEQDTTSDLENKIKNLSNTINDLQADIEEKEENISQLGNSDRKNKASVADLTKKLSDAESDNAKLSKLKKNLESQLTQLEEDFEQEKNDRKSLESQKKRLQQQLDETIANMDDSNQDVAALKKKVAKAKQQLSQTEAELDEANHVINTNQAQINNLNKKLQDAVDAFEEKEIEFNNLKKNNKQSELEIEDLRDEVEEFKTNVSNLNSQVSNLKADNEELQEQLDEEAENYINAANQLKDAKNQLSELESDLQTERQNNENLTKNKRILDARIQELELELERAKARIAALEKEKKNLTNELSNLQADYDALQTQFNKLTKTNKKQAKQIKGLVAEVDEARNADNGASSVEFQKLQRDFQELQDSVDDLNNANATLLKIKSENANTISELEEDLDTERNKVSRLERQNNILQEDMEDLRDEIEETIVEKFETMKKNHAKQIQDLNTELDAERSNSDSLAEKLNQLQQEIKTHAQNFDNLSNKHNSLRSDLDNAENRHQQANNKVSTLERQLQDAQKKHKKLQKKHDSVVSELARSSENSVSQHELSRHLDTANELKQQLLNETKAKQELDRTVQSLRSELKRIQDDLDDEQVSKESLKKNVQRLQDEINSHNETIDDLESEIDSQHREYNLILQELERYKSLASQAEDRSREKDSEVRNLQNALQSLQNQNDQNSERAKNLEKLVKRSEANVSDLEAEINRLNAQKAQAEKQVKKLSKKITELNSSHAVASKNVSDHQNQVAKLEQDISLLDSQISSANRQNTQLQKDLKQAQDKLRDAQHNSDESERKYAQVQSKLVAEQSHTHELEEQIEECNQFISNLQADMQRVDLRIRDASRSTDQESERADRAEKQVSEYQDTILQLRSQLQQQEQSFNAYQRKNKAAIRELEEHKAQNDTHSKRLQKADRKQNKLEKQLQLLQQQNDRDKRAREKDQKRVVEVEAELSRFQTKLNDSESKLINSEKDQKRVVEVEAELSRFQTKLNDSESKLINSENERKQLEAELQTLRRKFRRTNDELSAVQEDLERERRRKSESRKRVKSLFD